MDIYICADIGHVKGYLMGYNEIQEQIHGFSMSGLVSFLGGKDFRTHRHWKMWWTPDCGDMT